MKIVITGSPGGGFEFYGPFQDDDEADKWADQHLAGEDWWIEDLEEAQYE